MPAFAVAVGSTVTFGMAFRGRRLWHAWWLRLALGALLTTVMFLLAGFFVVFGGFTLGEEAFYPLPAFGILLALVDFVAGMEVLFLPDHARTSRMVIFGLLFGIAQPLGVLFATAGMFGVIYG